MRPFLKYPPVAGLLVAASTLALPAFAFYDECSVSLSAKTIAEQADKPEITTMDSVEHRPITVDFQGKTLGTIKPGDVVLAHGQPHVLNEIRQRSGWSQYTFATHSDVERYHTALSGGEGVEKVGVQDDGVEHDGGGGAHK